MIRNLTLQPGLEANAKGTPVLTASILTLMDSGNHTNLWLANKMCFNWVGNAGMPAATQEVGYNS